ncbi:hypothetical protein BKA70DRAFT_9714 [Coprinopsis sp. MPI-PUGE-AT-0042]|nr:hypothetical protein BKA70DRAFT_9714 [Coprinopsis sp. MPI-PUGE-AT-0042]
MSQTVRGYESPETEDGDVQVNSGLCLRSLDIWGYISHYIEPIDIISLRETCRALYRLSKQRYVWLKAARKTCIEHGVFLPSFPVASMQDWELEHLSVSPWRFNQMTQKHHAYAEPIMTRSFTPRLVRDGPAVRVHGVHLVPGGRYLLVSDESHQILLWDLGHNVNAPPKLTPLATLGLDRPMHIVGTWPTADLQGFRMFSRSSTPHATHPEILLQVHEIYPSSERPAFASAL